MRGGPASRCLCGGVPKAKMFNFQFNAPQKDSRLRPHAVWFKGVSEEIIKADGGLYLEKGSFLPCGTNWDKQMHPDVISQDPREQRGILSLAIVQPFQPLKL
jgi:hypothetical protein